MIAKHVPMRVVTKSDFPGLINYIINEQAKKERIGCISVTNCRSEIAQDAVIEVQAVQSANARAESDKTYHLIVSFRAGENPTPEVMETIESSICNGLGYGDHQRISVVHHDTDNVHIHIAINKIHPKFYTIHTPYNDHKTLAALCEELECTYGLEKDNHRARHRGAESRAADMERHTGIESLLGWIKRECMEEFQHARSWSEMHHIMSVNGLELCERGNGLVIKSLDGMVVKASTVSRDMSKAKLVSRFGPFEVSPDRQVQPKRRYQKRPLRMRINTDALYAKYNAERHGADAKRKTQWKEARDRKNRLIEAAKRSNRLRRAAIKVFGGSRLTKKLLYAQAYKALKDKSQKIQKQYQAEKKHIFDDYRRLVWADWLKQKALSGDTNALAALRARKTFQGLKGNTIKGKPRFGSNVRTQAAGTAEDIEVDNITKKGTIIFSAGACVIRDDGDKLQVSRETTPEGLQIALNLAGERYGRRITVNGTDDFKKQTVRAAVFFKIPITFADQVLESRRQQLLKENTDERQKNRRRIDPGGISYIRSKSAADRKTDNRDADVRTGTAGIVTVIAKPNVGRIGRVPPPQSQHRLRTLSQLGMVRITGGSEMLLPSDVSDNMEQQGTKSDHALRRRVFGGRVTQVQLAAAVKYIAEREEKREKIFDIPKHLLYDGEAGMFVYAGIRNIDGHPLALLKTRNEVLVMPIDEATAKRLRSKATGVFVTVTPTGSIRTSKGIRK